MATDTGAAAAIERRAMQVFEDLIDLEPAARSARIAAESSAVQAILAELQRADVAAGARFATDFIAASPDRDRTRPTQVGPYRLITCVGAGGMGEVWRAERVDGLFEQTVAVKLIRPGLLGVIAAARFAEERRLLAKLDHPAIARIIDGGVSPAGDWPYLVMDFVDGEPIDLWLRTRPIGVGERITLLMQAIDAVQAAHARFIAHADIKPENLLVTAEGRVRLVDFASRNCWTDRHMTRCGP